MPDRFTKDPDEVLDYLRDWSAVLDDDTITASEWIVDGFDEDDEDWTGVVVDSEANDDTTATIWLSGGTVGQTNKITNRIVTAGGRTFDKTLVFVLRSK